MYPDRTTARATGASRRRFLSSGTLCLASATGLLSNASPSPSLSIGLPTDLEFEWLQRDLASTHKPVVVLAHQRPAPHGSHSILNANIIRIAEILSSQSLCLTGFRRQPSSDLDTHR
jgi:hypothetical protein